MKKKTKISIICIISIFMIVLSSIIINAYAEKTLHDNFLEDSKVINVKKYGAKGNGVSDDTKAMQRALDEAHDKFKTVYIPEGIYKITSTLSLANSEGKFVKIQGDGKNKTILQADSSFVGNIITSQMRSGFIVENIGMVHEGVGSCIDSIFIRAHGCSFTSKEANTKDVLVFKGSNCRIAECDFIGENKNAYLIRHTHNPMIAINSFIVDNTFSGSAKGIRVNSETNSRIEGLKINGNTFTNTGTEQIRMETILHCDISENKMSGSSGSAIVIVPRGLMVHGLFICSNTIQAKDSCVYEAPLLSGSTDIHVANNIFTDSDYGVSTNSILGLMIINNNKMNGIRVAGVEFSQVEQAIVSDNQIEVADGADSICITATKGKIIVTNNKLNREMNNQITGATQVIENNTVFK